jgi:hypothetical protein
MAGRSVTTVWNDVLTLGMYLLDKSGKIADNVIDGLTALWYMSQANAIKKVPGAPSILIPIFYKKSTNNHGFYRGRDTMDLDPQDGFTNVEYQWKQHYSTVNLSGIELATAGGPDAITHLANARFEQALATAKDEINDVGIFDDGSANNYKAFTGLDALVPENGQGSYGDIDSSVAANAFWRPVVKTVGSATANLRRLLDQMFIDVRRSRTEGKPHLILGTPTFYAYAEQVLRAAGERFTLDATQKQLDMGLAPLRYKGIPIEYDHACPQDGSNEQAFVINFNYYKWYVHKGTFFRATRFIEPTDQDAFAAKILTYGEFCTNNRRHQGRFIGVTE